MQYINVVIDNKSEATDQFFTYRAADDVVVGDKVSVPFSHRKKPADGYVIETNIECSLNPKRILEVESVDRQRSLTAEMVDTALWMRRRYGVKYIDGVKMFTVGGKREKTGRTFKAVAQQDAEYPLTQEQLAAAQTINKSIDDGKLNVFLLKGVTNSGKTEVYMQAVQHCLELGKTAIVLVPEIALSIQMMRRFQERFGEEIVATLHSKLTTSDRLQEWLRIRSGEARIVIGARTAIFAPVSNLGLVVIDEEHESTYKSDFNPKYETVDIAYRRAGYFNAAVVLGSATPSVVSYYRASIGIYHLIEMNHRVAESRLPEIEIVDLCGTAARGKDDLIGERLQYEIGEALKRKEQIILFLNRRGFAPQIQCLDCGYRYVCPDCGITLTYHKTENAAVCHYCGKKFPPLRVCPECGSRYIRYGGAGTEKVEETVKAMFPDAVTDRFDLDTAKNQREIDRTITRFMRRKTDILVGTQILAKGLDFQNVSLVGIIQADVTLNIPDYRSSERTYQLITQVAGRAGRSSGRSRVIIQTYSPDSDAVRYAAQGDYDSFYRSELQHRKIMNYPPYSDIIAVSFTEGEGFRKSDPDPMKYAEDFRSRLMKIPGLPEETVFFEPRREQRKSAPDRSRVTFLIKAPKGSRNGFIVEYMKYRDQMVRHRSRCYIEIDVNPYGIV